MQGRDRCKFLIRQDPRRQIQATVQHVTALTGKEQETPNAGKRAEGGGRQEGACGLAEETFCTKIQQSAFIA